MPSSMKPAKRSPMACHTVMTARECHMPHAAQAECDAQSQRVRELESQAGGSSELQRQLEEQTSLARDLTEVQPCVSVERSHNLPPDVLAPYKSVACMSALRHNCNMLVMERMSMLCRVSMSSM